MNPKRWILRGQDTSLSSSLARVLSSSPIVAALLISRGCDDERTALAFLQPSYDQLHDPYLMLGIKEAVSRLQRAIAQDEKILTYNEHATACLTEEDLQSCVPIDAELSAESITFRLANELSSLEPFGAVNPRPVYLTRNLRSSSEPRVMKERHLKVHLAGPKGRPLETIWWNCLDHLGRTPDVKASKWLIPSKQMSGTARHECS